MRQSRVAQRVAIALLCLACFAPMASADNQVRSTKNADGSTKWEAIDSDSPDALSAAPAAPMTAAPASARSSHTSSARRASAARGGGAISVHKNRDGSVEAFCSGPSGVIPAGGFGADEGGSIGDGGGGDNGGGSVGRSNAGGGVTMTRNADGSIETSSSGPSGSWGHASSRHHVAHKAAHRHTAVSHAKSAHSSPAGHR